MLNRYKLIIIATIIAVYFTSLVYLIPAYRTLWFSLEFIILPIIYIIGYEILMERQEKFHKKEINKISEKLIKIETRYTRLLTKHMKNKKG